MDTFDMGRVVIEPHQFFMAMYADTVGIDQIRQERKRVPHRHPARLACSARPSPAPRRRRVGSREARSTPASRSRRPMAGIGSDAPPDRFAFTVYFDPKEAPVNHGIFGPEFTFTGEMIAGKITIGPPILLPVTTSAGHPDRVVAREPRWRRSMSDPCIALSAFGYASRRCSAVLASRVLLWSPLRPVAVSAEPVQCRVDRRLAHLAPDHAVTSCAQPTGATHARRADASSSSCNGNARPRRWQPSSAGTIRRSSCPGRTRPRSHPGPPAESGPRRARAGPPACRALRHARGHRGCARGLPATGTSDG